MQVDALASETHFEHHILPVMQALRRPGDWSGTNPDRPVIVASYGDVKRARRIGYTRIIRMEHGAGQSYRSGHGSYAGGRDHDDVGLFLTPNEYSAERWRAAYPNARVETIGCPKLDTLPAREYFIGIQSEAWRASLADIRAHLTTLGSDQDGNRLCVAHAIADASLSAPDPGSSRGTPPRRNTIDVGISPADLRQSTEQPDLGPLSTEVVRLAMSECTSSSDNGCQARVTSAGLPNDWRQRFVGIRLRSVGDSARPGLLTLRIPTTTFGCVSLAMWSTTAKAVITALEARQRVIALSWHWDCHSIAPETVSAFEHYRHVLGDVAAVHTTIGHGHPRALVGPPRLEKRYQRLGIPLVRDFTDVCRQADVYVCDNSSSIFEFAATGRPVVVLNSPAYRRNVEHGLRFWSAADVGMQVDRPDQLLGAIAIALEDAPERQRAREDALSQVYAYRTGAAERAAKVIEEWVG